MKKFITRLLLFSFILIGSLISVYFLTGKIVLNKTNYAVSKNIDKLIIGHSHSECAYNDSLINNFINASSSGTSYFYNYYALKPIIIHNKQLKTVFIEFTNNQIDKSTDEMTFGDKYLPFKMQVYESYIDKSGLEILLKENTSGLLNGYLKSITQKIKIIATSNYSYFYNRGGYVYLVRDKINEAIKKQNKLENTKVEKNSISEINIQYLEKCISFCEANNIKVYLIRSPMHKKYLAFNNEELFQKILTTKFKNIEFLDFKNYPLLDSEFSDLDHLNYRGAKKFSIWFNSLLEKGLLNHKNQEFINLEMEKLKLDI